jgi:hypothetical protein
MANATTTDTKAVEKTFKRLSRWYMTHQRPPSPQQMQPLWNGKANIDFEDFVQWKAEVGLKHGAVFEEDGTILFDEWTVPPHDQVIIEFNAQFDRQFRAIYANTNYYPVWIGDGTTGNPPLLARPD